MEREIKRTLFSFSTNIQKNISKNDYEIIVIDNGSSKPLSTHGYDNNVHILRIDNASQSPASAINEGLKLAKGDLVGVFIDGARMASPNLLSIALRAAKVHPRPIISTIGFHLGPDIQSRSILNGYNQQREDKLLEQANWEEDGYRLFDISVFAGSSSDGWFMPMGESNGIFLTQNMWDELGGYDENFTCKGGGLVNLDTYARSCALPNTELIVLLGEGTFHQIHGGTASNATTSPWIEFHEEYIRIRGHAYKKPENTPLYIGHIPQSVLPFIEKSAHLFNNRNKQKSIPRMLKSLFKAFSSTRDQSRNQNQS